MLVAEAILDIDADRLKRTTNLALVESALAAQFAGFGDHELHPEAATKAAILCSRHREISEHEFVAWTARHITQRP